VRVDWRWLDDDGMIDESLKPRWSLKDSKRLKIGRCCDTCRYSQPDGTCKKTKVKTSRLARCLEWRLPKGPEKLTALEAGTDTVGLVLDPDKRRMHYPKTARSGDKRRILALTCETCQHRSGGRCLKPESPRFRLKPIPLGVCRHHTVSQSKVNLGRWERALNEIGVDTQGSVWRSKNYWWVKGKRKDTE
jgi:hypothetical protein